MVQEPDLLQNRNEPIKNAESTFTVLSPNVSLVPTPFAVRKSRENLVSFSSELTKSENGENLQN